MLLLTNVEVHVDYDGFPVMLVLKE